ncbi:PIR protein, putative [Plasmodium sp.]|nr:PIR protein, putative [Plasmodium sp.]
MKLNYTKILLFSVPLNILVTSSYANSENKQYITLHTPTTTSRVLSECDIDMRNYNNDQDMKSVKENFERQTSQRFEEYEERMTEKRQKYKEQRDKDIQKIILKDKMEKSLAEKVEKGCLMCGCGLGGVAAGVGLLGTVVVNELKKAALLAAESTAKADGAAAGLKAGETMGVKTVITRLETTFPINKLGIESLESIINAENYTNSSSIFQFIHLQYKSKCPSFGIGADTSLCDIFGSLGLGEGDVLGNNLTTPQSIKVVVEGIVSDAERAVATETASVTATKTAALKKAYMDAVQVEFNGYITSIHASIIAILIIVLVMVIIYLILRYRRKKKVKKKNQYTKLLKE